MKCKTFICLTLFLFASTLIQCGSKKPALTYSTSEDAARVIEERNAKLAKSAKKLKKDALKRNYKMQSKAVRKSLKRNDKAMKRRLKNIQYRKVGTTNF